MPNKHQKTVDDLELKLANILREVDETDRSGEEDGSCFNLPSLDEEQLDADNLDEFRLANRCLKMLQQNLNRVDETARIQDSTPASQPGRTSDIDFQTSVPNRIGRFEIVRELGRGGFGVVLLALDPLLDRQVALKIPKPDSLANEHSRLRFEREARSAAILGHPAIVPIYESGTVGLIHYIVFGYCEGVTLAYWMNSFQNSIDERTAARIVSRLADAVQHAHSRGIIHRDLKPGNVLVHFPKWESLQSSQANQELNQTDVDAVIDCVVNGLKITDFGLAKTCSLDESNLTGTGALIGTPAYMSPEQARGDVGEIGFGSDIYSLGVMLYELITARRPFEGTSDFATLQAIVGQEPTPPARLRSGLAPELNAICLKCLEKSPSNRYATAQALADDLNDWLDGRPVKAKPTTATIRMLRWCQRNPAIAAISAIAIGSILIGTSLVTWQWLRAESNLAEARWQRDRAELHLSRVDKTIDQMVSNLSQRVQFLPQLKPFRDQMLEQALSMQRQLVEGAPSDDSAENYGICTALIRIASLQLQLDDPKSAQATIDEVKLRVERLPNDGPNSIQHLELSARADQVAGRIFLAQRKYEDARKSTQQAIDGLQQLTDQNGSDVDYLIQLAESIHQLGILFDSKEEHQQALEFFNQSIEVLDRLNPEQQDSLVAMAQRSASHNSLAIVWKKMGQLETAEFHYKQAAAVVDSILELAEEHVRFHDQRGSLSLNLGNLYLAQGKFDEAAENYQRSSEIFERLSDDFPGVTDYHERWSLAANGLGTSQMRLGQLDEAEQSLQKSIEAADQLGELKVNRKQIGYLLGTALTNLSNVYSRQGKFEQAQAALVKAIAYKNELLDAAPESVTYRTSLGTTLANLATVQRKRGEIGLAIDNFGKALEHFATALQSRPSDVILHQRIAKTNLELIVLLCRDQRYDASIVAAKRAAEHFPDDAQLHVAILDRLFQCMKLTEEEVVPGQPDPCRELYRSTWNEFLAKAMKIDKTTVERLVAKGKYSMLTDEPTSAANVDSQQD